MKTASDSPRTGLGEPLESGYHCVLIGRTMELGLTGTEAVCCQAFVHPSGNVPRQLAGTRVISREQAHRGRALLPACSMTAYSRRTLPPRASFCLSLL
jgi:hypothetical protein